jgi:hypothetical protein
MGTKMDKAYRELLNEYRLALGFFNGIRSLYSATSPEVAAAAKRLEELENTLASYDRSALGTLAVVGLG